MSFYKRTNKTVLKALTLSEAKKKLMDLVARRDHSEKELRQKLSLRCEDLIVQQTLTWAREQNWLASPDKLKTQFAEQLGRRGKGIRKINQKLKDLGLDTVKPDLEIELSKAKKLVLAKWSPQDFEGLDYKEALKLRAKIMRFLVARGYEGPIINLILKTEFKKSATPNENEEDHHDEEF